MRLAPARLLLRLPRWMVAVGDQALVAVLNLLLSVTITQVGGVLTLGRFAVVNTTILLAVGFTRLLVSDPWLASRTAPRRPSGELQWLMAVAAVITALVVAAVVRISCGGDGRWYLACVISPLVVIQDFGRYIGFRQERPARAFASDACVLLAACVTFAAVSLVSSPDLTTVLAAWLVGIIGGMLIGTRLFARQVTVSGSTQWWVRFCRPLAGKLALDGVAFLVAVNGSLYLLAYLGTQRDVGVVRIVQTVFSPATLTITGLTMWLVPLLATRAPERASAVRRQVTIALALGSVPAAIAAVLLGPWFIRIVFGVDDAPSALALSLAGLATVGLAVAAPSVAGARVSGHYAPIAWTRALSAVITWAGLALLPWLRGIDGYLGLLALQSVMIAATALWTQRRVPHTTVGSRA